METDTEIRIIGADRRLAFGRGAFSVRRLMPGGAFRELADTGLFGLGLVDHAQLSEGLVVRMHQHRNDEIVSYLRSGEMIHTDSTGDRAVLSPSRLMAMNAGTGFWHEESVPIGRVEMLQIFVRPEEPDLPPNLQIVDLNPVVSEGRWREFMGPSDTGVTRVRSRVRGLDAHLAPGGSLPLPPAEGFDAGLLYVFAGKASFGMMELGAGDSATWIEDRGLPTVSSDSGADLVLFRIDRDAPYSRAGTLSG